MINMETVNLTLKLLAPSLRLHVIKALCYLRRAVPWTPASRGEPSRTRSGPERRAQGDCQRHSAEASAAAYGGLRYLR